MSETGFLGLRATEDFATNEMPEHWRQGILRLFPNGTAPLTALTSLAPVEPLDSPIFHWWGKTLAAQGGAVTSVYVNADLSTEYVYATHQAAFGIAAATVYAKMAVAVANHFRAGHVVLLRDASRSDVDIVAEVTAVVKNGASSYIACKLLEADDNSATSSSYNLATVDTALIIGNANAENSAVPDAVTYDPTGFEGFTQIFRNPLDLSGTALETHLRTEQALKEARREALLYHGVEMERAGLWGVKYSTYGTNGKPLRFCQGMIPFIKEHASANVAYYDLDTDYSGDAWKVSGMDWLNKKLEVIFRYQGEGQSVIDKMAFVGSGAMLGIQQLAETYGAMNLQPAASVFGMKIREWVTPFGSIFLKTHPLFSFESTNRNAMVIFNPTHVKFRPLRNRDTKFYPDEQYTKGGPNRIDGVVEEYQTEGGWQFEFPLTFGYLGGVGVDNSV